MAWQLKRELGSKPPGAVEQIFFGFFWFVQRIETFTHDHMARSAGAAHVAGMFDVDVVV